MRRHSGVGPHADGCRPGSRICRFALACLAIASAWPAWAQRLDSLTVEPQPALARSVVRLHIALSVRSRNDPWCGLAIDFGDGSAQDVRVGDRGQGDLALDIEHRYEKAGTYVIAVRGKNLIRGLRTAFSCDGELQPLSLLVKEGPAS